MPAFFLETPNILPLPSLRSYTTISVLLLSCSIWYAFTVTSEPDFKLNATLLVDVTLGSDNGSEPLLSPNETYHLGLLLDSPSLRRLTYVVYLMFHEPLCIWALINMAYCCLILLGKVIQTLVFGELRVSEQQHLKDRFWNFVFYKFLFIFGVMSVPSMDEVVLWCSWFSLLGFLSLLAQLCKDRFEYLSFSPMTPKWTHIRLLMLLIGILGVTGALFGLCILVGLHAGWNTFAFMGAECCLVGIKGLYVTVRYGLHLWDLHSHGVWENRGVWGYYVEFIFEMIVLIIDFAHHGHMLFWSNISLSMASLVILLQLRYLFYEIKKRIRKHKNYLQVVTLMESNFPVASHSQLSCCDDCAICWESMEAARVLPCTHLFHTSCLRLWLEQDTSCPTCRCSLDGGGTNNPPNADTYFTFDGSRYAYWLPVVSVQVSRDTGITRSPIESSPSPTRVSNPSLPTASSLLSSSSSSLSTSSASTIVENENEPKFSKSPREREMMLAKRKSDLMIKAKKNYLAKMAMAKAQS